MKESIWNKEGTNRDYTGIQMAGHHYINFHPTKIIQIARYLAKIRLKKICIITKKKNESRKWKREKALYKTKLIPQFEIT